MIIDQIHIYNSLIIQKKNNNNKRKGQIEMNTDILIQLEQELIVNISDDRYQVRIVSKKETNKRINSDHKIIFADTVEISTEKGTGNKVILVDSKLQWVIYHLQINAKGNLDLTELTKGTIIVQETTVQTISVVAVHHLEHKLIFILNPLAIFYAPLPLSHPPLPHLLCRPYLPYAPPPPYQHHPFSHQLGFLPLSQHLTYCLLILRPNNKHLLLLAFHSPQNKMSGVYGVEMYDGELRSSRHVLFNVDGKVLGMYDLGKGRVVVQSGEKVVVWDLKRDGNTQTTQIGFKTALTLKEETLIGVTHNHSTLRLTLSPEGVLQQHPYLLPPLPSDQLPLQISPSSPPYLLTTNHHLYLLTSPPLLLIHNLFTSLTRTSLYSSPYHNFLIARKQRALETETIAYGNHLLGVGAEHIQHGMMLRGVRRVGVRQEGNGVELGLASGMVGVVGVRMEVGEKGGEVELVERGWRRQETLLLREDIQVTPQSIYCLGKSLPKSTQISKLFQDCTDSVTSAAVIGDMLALSIMDQIHIFELKTYKRRYIYCCNDEVKELYSLNGVNVLGIQCWNIGGREDGEVSRGSQLIVLVLKEDRAEKRRTISIPEQNSHIQLGITVNTAEYCLNLFHNSLVLCSNDPLHRYQPEKIVVQDYTLTLPTQAHLSYLVPLTVTHSPTATDCLLIEPQPPSHPHFQQARLYLISFSPKYLIKDPSLHLLTYQLQHLPLISTLPTDIPIQAILHQYGIGSGKSKEKGYKLLLLGEKTVSLWKLKQGKVEAGCLEDKGYFLREVEKLELVPEEVRDLATTITSDPVTRILPTLRPDHYLILTARQLYLVGVSSHSLCKLGYYSLLNDAFLPFRSNLSLSQLNDQQYLSLFNQKMVIHDAKYLSHQRILLLYRVGIVVLEIVANQGVVVRQEIRFSKEEGVVQVEEFLHNHSHNSIYLREKNGRIYILKENSKTQLYQLEFHSYTEEDVSLFARVRLWHQGYRTQTLAPQPTNQDEQAEMEEIIVKKDGQLIVKGSSASPSDNDKMVYL